MPVVRVKLAGKGTENDPYHAPLPTYREILTNYDQGYVLALVPETEFHDKDVSTIGKVEATGHGPMLVELSADQHEKWYQHLDSRYSEREGQFRPEVI